MTDDYDSGSPLDDYSYRRRKRRRLPEGDVDDEWGVADDEDIFDQDAEIEDLAAGYVYDPDRADAGPMSPEVKNPRGLGPISGAARRLAERRRSAIPRQERIRRHYDPEQAYADSPSYHKDKRSVVERILSPLSGESGSYEPTKLKRDDSGIDYPGAPVQVPFWGIVILVVLGVVALLVVVLACVSVLFLLRP